MSLMQTAFNPASWAQKALLLAIKAAITLLVEAMRRPICHNDPALATAHVLMLARCAGFTSPAHPSLSRMRCAARCLARSVPPRVARRPPVAAPCPSSSQPARPSPPPDRSAPLDASEGQTQILLRDMMDNNTWGYLKMRPDYEWIGDAHTWIQSLEAEWLPKIFEAKSAAAYNKARSAFVSAINAKFFKCGVQPMLKPYKAESEAAERAQLEAMKTGMAARGDSAALIKARMSAGLAALKAANDAAARNNEEALADALAHIKIPKALASSKLGELLESGGLKSVRAAARAARGVCVCGKGRGGAGSAPTASHGARAAAAPLTTKMGDGILWPTLPA